MKPPIVNLENVAFVKRSQGEKFEAQIAPVGAEVGDFISLPPGRDSAHQIINDSSAPLRYLAVSTMENPEVVEYPDSGKLGIFAGESGRGGRPASPDSIRHIARVSEGVDYWEGEK